MHLAAIAVVVLLTASLTMYWIASRKRAANVRASAPAELQLPTETPSPAVAPATQANKDQVMPPLQKCPKSGLPRNLLYRDAFSVLTREAMLVRCLKASDTIVWLLGFRD